MCNELFQPFQVCGYQKGNKYLLLIEWDEIPKVMSPTYVRAVCDIIFKNPG